MKYKRSWINTAELAKILKVSRFTIYNWKKKGLITPELNVKNMVRWDFQKVLRQLKQLEEKKNGNV